jgi:hypothetical protein
VGQNNDAVPAYPSNYSTLVGTNTEPAASFDSVIAVASLTSTSNVTATPGPGPGQITVSWQDNSGNETSFRIYRCGPHSCTSVTQVGTVGANVTTFTNSSLGSGGFYQFAVRAVNGTLLSSYSNGAGATAP